MQGPQYSSVRSLLASFEYAIHLCLDYSDLGL
jgi:hypothetical protein